MEKGEFLFLLVGRSGSGKSSLAQSLNEAYGLTISRSYTTRPPRTRDDNEYVFLPKDEFEKKSLCDSTNYNGQFYGIDTEGLDAADIHVCDPNGITNIQ